MYTTPQTNEDEQVNGLQEVDPQIEELINEEYARQHRNLELIASENFASRAVMEAVGSCLTNKYAEGYPGDRYYGGCEIVDKVEELARRRAREIYEADHVNVQPHAGSQANEAVYFAFVPQGGTILGMDLSHGGHLTHGSPHNFSGQYFNFVPYGVHREEETIDYEEVERLAHQHQPDLIVAGASAYPRVIDFDRFQEIADEVGSLLMVDMAHIAGLVAAGLHPNPVPVADLVTATTHKTLRGARGGVIFCKEEYARQVDKAVFPGLQGGPLMHVVAGKAVTFKQASGEKFFNYQKRIISNAQTLAEQLKARGFRLVSGGTDNHLMLVDLRDLGITGKEAEAALERAGITVKKNNIPFDDKGPDTTSGIRIGTPAVTTFGMEDEEMAEIAELISTALRNIESDGAIREVRAEVRDLMNQFGN